MKVKVLWQVLQVLLEEMKKKYETTNKNISKIGNSLTDYYFLTEEKRQAENRPTIGWALQQRFPKKKLAEKSVYNYVYIPASKQRDQFFSLKKQYPTIFFQFIGFNNILSFLDWCVDKNKLTTELILQQRELLKAHADQQKQYFFCYFPIKKKVARGIASFTNWNVVQLNYLDSQEKEVQLKGKMERKRKQLSISLSRDYQLDLKQDSEITFLNLFWANDALAEQQFFQGTFVGVDRKGRPIASKIIFEKISAILAKSSELTFVNNKYAELTKNSLLIKNPALSPLAEIDKISDTRQKQLEKLSGIYLGYICVLKNEQPTLFEAISIIRPDGSVDCKGYSNIYYKGHVKILSGGGYAKLFTITDDGVHQFTYLLELKYKNDQVSHMEGAYVGSFKNKLVSGREYFERKGAYSSDREKEIDIQLQEISFTDLLRKNEPFAVKLRNYYLEREQTSLLHQLAKPIECHFPQERINGTYLLYFFSSARNIRKYILKINVAKNKVFLKTNNRQHIGTFIISGTFLFLRLQPIRHSKEYLTQVTAFIGDAQTTPRLATIEGVVSGLSDDEHIQRPVSVRCVLIKTEQRYEWQHSEQINLGSPAFAQLNHTSKFPDLGYYLAGSHRNFIETHPIANFKDFRNSKDKELFNKPYFSHGKTLFKAACFTATQVEQYLKQKDIKEEALNQLIEELILQLTDAFNHGFGYTQADKKFFEQQKKTTLKRYANAFVNVHEYLRIDKSVIHRYLPIPRLVMFNKE